MVYASWSLQPYHLWINLRSLAGFSRLNTGLFVVRRLGGLWL